MTPDEERLIKIRDTLKEADRYSHRFSFTNDDIKFLLAHIDQLQIKLQPVNWEMG